MRVALLGPLRAVQDDGTPIEIGGARLRTLLARLALDPGRPVSAEALIDGLWGDTPPADAANALQSLVSRLRKALGAGSVESGAAGYRLALQPDDVDVSRFERLAADGRRELTAGRETRAAELLADAMESWRGTALADVLDAPFAGAPAARLEELRIEAAEDLYDARIRVGQHAEVLADLTALAGEHPLRERLAGLRVRALCAAGRQSDALAVYAAIRETLADQLGVDPSAELQEIHLAALRGEFAPLAPVTDRLPTRLNSFVGRDDELKLLAELLDGARLVTLAGPGGAGKTRLAIEAASRHPAQPRGRVWFVPLAGVRDPQDVLGALVNALEVRDLRSHEADIRRRTVETSMEHVVDILGGAESLLVLDNCEHVIDAAARLVDALLTRVPSVRVIATSREPLAITGEVLCPLGPLPVPGEQASVEEAGELGAMRLFLDRAVAVRPDFVLNASTVDDVARICRSLDGMPLALELAAARLRSMTVAQIARRLDDRFRLLTSGSRTALPRQRTLRAVVEWSWDLLTDAELMLARRLSVFATGACVEAIEVVCADDALAEADIFYVLGSLVEKSIVDAVEDSRGEQRYRMLETIRVYARERLSEADEEGMVRARMFGYYVELVERLEPKLRSREQLDTIARYEDENANMLAALRSAIELSEVDTASRLLGGIFWYMSTLGQGELAKSLVGQVLEFGDRLRPDFRAAMRMIGAMMQMPSEMPSAERVRELVEDCLDSHAIERFPAFALAMPMLAFLNGDKVVAQREIERAKGLPDPWARAAACWAESFVLIDSGELDAADATLERALTGFKEVGDRWGTAMARSFQALNLSQRGNSAEAIASYQEGLRLALELKSPDDIAQQWWRLILEHVRACDLVAAEREIEAARRYAAGAGNRQLDVITMLGELEILVQRGEYATAREEIPAIRERSEVLAIPREILQEWTGTITARLDIADGRLDEAESWALAAMRKSGGRPDFPDLAASADLLAVIRLRQGQPEEAATVLGLAARLRGTFDHGDPETRRLVGLLREELSESRYEELIEEARSVSKKDAFERLLAPAERRE
ncbi:BTAD domain-containing putative transcriptional regulator [Amycolatopsis sp. NPDC059027]|uniref:BTAD domain-containing putative transcriptional regulator n=1 Tax=Amycolatopsis sp. NPDC059027 TaxID=3346709 RepID=UPI00366BC7EA